MTFDPEYLRFIKFFRHHKLSDTYQLSFIIAKAETTNSLVHGSNYHFCKKYHKLGLLLSRYPTSTNDVVVYYLTPEAQAIRHAMEVL